MNQYTKTIRFVPLDPAQTRWSVRRRSAYDKGVGMGTKRKEVRRAMQTEGRYLRHKILGTVIILYGRYVANDWRKWEVIDMAPSPTERKHNGSPDPMGIRTNPAR